MTVLTHNWWALAIRGLAAIIFGILAFVWPAITLTALVLLFGAYMVTDGIFAMIAGANVAGREKKWWLLFLSGILGVIAGVLTFIFPGLAALYLIYVIAFWAVFTGALGIGSAIRLRKEIQGEWLLVLSGIVSILFGFVMLLFPAAGALVLIWWIGAYALVFGVLLLVLAFKLRSWDRKVPHGEPRIA